MKYLSKIETGIVVNVIVIDDGVTLKLDGEWIESNETEFPSVGYTYTIEEGFRPPKIFNSWIWNTTEKYWEAPIPIPDEENIYEWDEDNVSWKLTYIKYAQ